MKFSLACGFLLIISELTIDVHACFSLILRSRRDVNYDDAVKFCAEKDRDLAVIPDANTYNTLVDTVKLNLKYLPLKSASIWIKTLYDPNSDDVTPAGAYVNWYSAYPESKNPEWKNIYILVDASEETPTDGMLNSAKDYKGSGVACQI